MSRAPQRGMTDALNRTLILVVVGIFLGIPFTVGSVALSIGGAA